MENNETDIFSYLISHEDFRDWVVNPSEEKNIYWKSWMNENPEAITEVKKAREFIERMTFKKEYLSSPELDGLLDKIMRQEEPVLQSQSKLEDKSREFFTLTQWMRVAAILLICFVSAVLVNRIFPTSPIESPVPVIAWRTIDNPKGIKSDVILPDGTRVMLNAASSIKYPEIFSDTLRVVELTGEAFFDVVRNEKKPFIIKTERMTTEVLGTSFNIRAFAHGESQFTAVVSGSVKVSNSRGDAQILQPNEMGVIGEDNNINKEPFDVKHITGWKDGIISFKRASFVEIEEQLSLWYGVEFDIEEGFKMDSVYTGEFTNETLENVLHGISYSSGFTYKISDNKVYINQ